MMKVILSIVLMLATLEVAATEVLVEKPSGEAKGMVVIAPAKKYLMKERLFTELAKSLNAKGYITVRFNWSQSTLEVPELELTRAAEDLNQVVTEVQREFGFGADKTVLISKSFSTKAVNPSIALATTHILLTPNCSVEAPFEKTYGEILTNSNISLSMLISNEDPNCDVHQIHRTLAGIAKLPVLLTTHGDHNFIVSQDGASDYRFQDEVIRFVSGLVK